MKLTRDAGESAAFALNGGGGRALDRMHKKGLQSVRSRLQAISLAHFSKKDYVKSHKVDGVEPDDASSYIFTVKKPAKYFDNDGNCIETLQPETSLLTTGSKGGLKMGWCMWFNKMRLEDEFVYYDLNQKKLTGAYVELEYNEGSFGTNRTIW